MNRTIPLFFFLMSLPACRSDNKVLPLQLAGCDDVSYPRSVAINEVETFVIAKTYTRIDGSSLTDYYLNQPNTANPSIPWIACNLPDAYKKDKLVVRINGYVLTPPANVNMIGSPIELTSIEIHTPAH